MTRTGRNKLCLRSRRLTLSWRNNGVRGSANGVVSSTFVTRNLSFPSVAKKVRWALALPPSIDKFNRARGGDGARYFWGDNLLLWRFGCAQRGHEGSKEGEFYSLYFPYLCWLVENKQHSPPPPGDSFISICSSLVCDHANGAARK